MRFLDIAISTVASPSRVSSGVDKTIQMSPPGIFDECNSDAARTKSPPGRTVAG